jgi:hypothetical protein
MAVNEQHEQALSCYTGCEDENQLLQPLYFPRRSCEHHLHRRKYKGLLTQPGFTQHQNSCIEDMQENLCLNLQGPCVLYVQSRS